MKPAIYEVKTKAGRMAWLVDEHSTFIANDESGKPRQHFAAAVEISDLQAGELRESPHPKTGKRTIFGPRCCALMMVKQKTENLIKSRGFDQQAAEVLLELAAARNNLSANFASKTWEFSTPAERGVPQSWDDSKFLAAWRWSFWQCEKLTGSQRHADMVALGYPYSASTLRKMLSKMGLAKPQQGPR